ncbi:MAG: ABC transporter permease [Propionibacteriaceae bacterium]|nr:ABC transporter permease [Propionibacteriaceae bacterium]
MFKYILRRLANYIILLFVAVTGTYFLAAACLNPYSIFALRQPPVNPAVVENMMRKYNLSDQVPVLERYWTWLTNVLLHWDWGRSPLGAYVNDQIGTRMWVSLRLVLLGTLIGTVVGVALGVWAAVRQYKVGDRVYTVIVMITLSTPTVVLAVISMILATKLNHATGMQIIQFTGMHSANIPDYWGAHVVDTIKHLLLPTIVLIIIQASVLSRMQRNLMLDSLGADYVRTARAKGLTKPQAVRRHALRTALIPIGTQVAFSIPLMFVGAIVTETLFSWEGLGKYTVSTINGMDINGVVAVTAFTGVMICVGAILSDIIVSILDPRVRLG